MLEVCLFGVNYYIVVIPANDLESMVNTLKMMHNNPVRSYSMCMTKLKMKLSSGHAIAL